MLNEPHFAPGTVLYILTALKIAARKRLICKEKIVLIDAIIIPLVPDF